MINVTDGTNVNVRLCSLENGIGPVHVCELCCVLPPESRLQRARVAILETVSGGPQEWRNGSESRWHF